jgi:hypothetical protein
MFHSPQYHTACQIQKLILGQMGLEISQANQTPKPMPEGKKPKLTPSELANLAKSWDLIENRKRILRGKGLPKPIEPATKKRPITQETFRE